MKQGVGISRNKDLSLALAEAYRGALQNLKALKADYIFVAYTYDHGLDPELLSGLFKRQFRDVPHLGWSTWSGWTSAESFEAESGVLVLALKDLPASWDLLKIYSIKEKQGLWASELSRFLDLQSVNSTSEGSVFLVADSIHFQTEEGFDRIQKDYPQLKVFGFGASYGIPQCSIVVNGEIYSNAMAAFYFPNTLPWTLLIQNICPESSSVHINRMSENLVIEIDEKPAFYRLCEHLMAEDDLPMMSPDEFRKHMGNLFIVEKYRDSSMLQKHLGEVYRIVSLLGSEMTTGMVAVGDTLNFSRDHFLGQKKVKYVEEGGAESLKALKEKLPNPSMLWMFCSSSHLRDKERRRSDLQVLKSVFPQTPIFGVGTHMEFLQMKNLQTSLIVAFD